MPDVIHDPRTDWCACAPEGDVRCDYRLLADTVNHALNPPDGDEAEVATLITAVERAAEFIRTCRCYCTPGDDGEPCRRCAALGERHRKPVDR